MERVLFFVFKSEYNLKHTYRAFSGEENAEGMR